MREERARQEGQRTEARRQRQREIGISRQSLLQVDRTGTVSPQGPRKTRLDSARIARERERERK